MSSRPCSHSVTAASLFRIDGAAQRPLLRHHSSWRSEQLFRRTIWLRTIFKIAPSQNGTWKEQVIYSFHGGDGFLLYGQLAFDKAGDVSGTTYYGGNAGGCTYGFDIVNCGVAFKLSQSNGVWSEQVLVNFANGPLGGQPDAGLVLDRAGNLYGVSFSGGKFDAGLVYKISNL